MVEVTVVIPFHSNRNMLRLCLDSLRETLPPEVEILIVHNNAADSELDVKELRKYVRIIREHRDLGYSTSANLGASAARGRLLVFCDADTVYSKGWIETMLRHHRNRRNIGISSAKLLDPGTNRIVDFGIGFTEYNSPHPDQDQPCDWPLTRNSRRVQAACSACMMIEKRLFRRMGGFDESLGNYYMDIDLCLRLKDFDRECRVVAPARVFHHGSDFALRRGVYKQPSLKADVKGRFMANNAHRIDRDMDKYLRRSIAFYLSRHLIEREYLLCDLMNVIDHAWYADILRERFRIVEHYVCPTRSRDSAAENLLYTLDVSILQLRVPIIYLVDRFVGLRDNHIWWKCRPVGGDLIVDRNANVVGVDSLVTEKSANQGQGRLERSVRSVDRGR